MTSETVLYADCLECLERSECIRNGGAIRKKDTVETKEKKGASKEEG